MSSERKFKKDRPQINPTMWNYLLLFFSAVLYLQTALSFVDADGCADVV